MTRKILPLLFALIFTGMSTYVSDAATITAAAGASDFPMYLGSPDHGDYARGDDMLTRQNAGSIVPRWQTAVTAPVSAQPVISNGFVFWGAWDGYERATTTSGRAVWSTYLGQTVTPPACRPATLGIASTPAIASIVINHHSTSVLFVGGGDAKLYALDAVTGKVIWSDQLGPKGSAFVWSSPVVYDGSVFIGLASVGDCPLVGGKVFKIGAARGVIHHVFNAIAKGCVGAGVWGTVTLDVERQRLYFVTGNANPCKGRALGESIIEVKSSDLSLVGTWAVPQSARGWDTDFGSTPTLFTAHMARGTVRMVGAVNKNGIYYAFERDNLHAGPVWQRRVGVGGSRPDQGTGDIAPSAWDGSTLFVGAGNTTIAGKKCPGSLRALNPATGAPIWQDCLPGAVLAAPVVTPTLVEVGAGSSVTVVSSTTGGILFQHIEPNAQFWGPASICDGTIYIPNMAGNIYFVSPPDRSTKPASVAKWSSRW